MTLRGRGRRVGGDARRAALEWKTTDFATTKLVQEKQELSGEAATTVVFSDDGVVCPRCAHAFKSVSVNALAARKTDVIGACRSRAWSLISALGRVRTVARKTRIHEDVRAFGADP